MDFPQNTYYEPERHIFNGILLEYLGELLYNNRHNFKAVGFQDNNHNPPRGTFDLGKIRAFSSWLTYCHEYVKLGNYEVW